MFLYFYHSSIPGRTALAPSSAEDRAIPVSAEIQCKALPGSIMALRESQCPSEFPKNPHGELISPVSSSINLQGLPWILESSHSRFTAPACYFYVHLD